MLDLKNLENRMFIALSVFIILASVAIEFYSPPGVYLSCGFVIAVMLTLYADSKFITLGVSGISVALVLASVFYLHVDEDFTIVVINHSFTLAGITVAMFFVLYVLNLQERAEKDNKQVGSLFTHAAEGIVVTNKAGVIVLVNPLAEKMFGYEKNELIGKRVEALVPEAVRPRHIDYREKFHQHPVNRATGAGRDLYAVRKDGKVFPVEISLSSYKLGKESYVTAFIIDITVRKKNDEELRAQKLELERVTSEIKKLNTDLEQKVQDRTIMLRETLGQLERSKDELSAALDREKELGDLKSRFVSTVSHEFRTPLSTILSSATLIGKYDDVADKDKRERHIERIKESVKHMNAMLEALLSLGRLEEGLVVANADTFELRKFMSDFIMEMEEIAKKGQKLVYSEKGETMVITDKRLLKNILINLVTNAIKFSPEDSVIALNAVNEGGFLKLAVKDSGMGISEEDQMHLFERFFRARNAANVQGTGLGLHIVSKYLELLGGNIYLESKLNEGTTFMVTIPSI